MKLYNKRPAIFSVSENLRTLRNCGFVRNCVLWNARRTSTNFSSDEIPKKCQADRKTERVRGTNMLD